MRLVSKATLAALFSLSVVGLASADTVVIAPEQETVIRQYVASHSVASVDLPGVEVSVGTALPETVELHAMEVPDVSYRYVVIGDRTLLVEPETRKVVHILD
jgi:hypothetical protein